MQATDDDMPADDVTDAAVPAPVSAASHVVNKNDTALFPVPSPRQDRTISGAPHPAHKAN